MKKSALLLTTFIFLCACQNDINGPQIIEVVDNASDIEIIEIPDVGFEEEIFLVVEEHASFKGGTAAWAAHVKENLTYPEQAKRLGVEGRVFLSFIVDKNGRLSDAQIVKGIGAGCDQVALNMLKASPDCLAGKQRGKKVNSRMQVAATFKIAE